MSFTADTDASAGGDSARTRHLALLSALIVAVVTVLLLVVSAEIVLRLRWKEPYMFDRRLMFFSEGHNFVNKPWGGFAYEPNTTIHAENVLRH